MNIGKITVFKIYFSMISFRFLSIQNVQINHNSFGQDIDDLQGFNSSTTFFLFKIPIIIIILEGNQWNFHRSRPYQ